MIIWAWWGYDEENVIIHKFYNSREGCGEGEKVNNQDPEHALGSVPVFRI